MSNKQERQKKTGERQKLRADKKSVLRQNPFLEKGNITSLANNLLIQLPKTKEAVADMLANLEQQITQLSQELQPAELNLAFALAGNQTFTSGKKQTSFSALHYIAPEKKPLVMKMMILLIVALALITISGCSFDFKFIDKPAWETEQEQIQQPLYDQGQQQHKQKPSTEDTPLQPVETPLPTVLEATSPQDKIVFSPAPEMTWDDIVVVNREAGFHAISMPAASIPDMSTIPEINFNETTISVANLKKAGFYSSHAQLLHKTIPLHKQAQTEALAAYDNAVPWPVTVAILGMENSFNINNPRSAVNPEEVDNGPYQIVGGGYSPGQANSARGFINITKTQARSSIIEHGGRVGVNMDVANGDISLLSWQNIADFGGSYNGLTPVVSCPGGAWAYGEPDGTQNSWRSAYVASYWNELPQEVKTALGLQNLGFDTTNMWARRRAGYSNCNGFVKLQRYGFAPIVAMLNYAQMLENGDVQ